MRHAACSRMTQAPDGARPARGDAIQGRGVARVDAHRCCFFTKIRRGSQTGVHVNTNKCRSTGCRVCRVNVHTTRKQHSFTDHGISQTHLIVAWKVTARTRARPPMLHLATTCRGMAGGFDPLCPPRTLLVGLRVAGDCAHAHLALACATLAPCLCGRHIPSPVHSTMPHRPRLCVYKLCYPVALDSSPVRRSGQLSTRHFRRSWQLSTRHGSRLETDWCHDLRPTCPFGSRTTWYTRTVAHVHAALTQTDAPRRIAAAFCMLAALGGYQGALGLDGRGKQHMLMLGVREQAYGSTSRTAATFTV